MSRYIDALPVGFTLCSTNLSQGKPYNTAYQRIRDSFRLTQEEPDKKLAVHARFLNHFYTEEEIQNIQSRWLAA